MDNDLDSLYSEEEVEKVDEGVRPNVDEKPRTAEKPVEKSDSPTPEPKKRIADEEMEPGELPASRGEKDIKEEPTRLERKDNQEDRSSRRDDRPEPERKVRKSRPYPKATEPNPDWEALEPNDHAVTVHREDGRYFQDWVPFVGQVPEPEPAPVFESEGRGGYGGGGGGFRGGRDRDDRRGPRRDNFDDRDGGRRRGGDMDDRRGRMDGDRRRRDEPGGFGGGRGPGFRRDDMDSRREEPFSRRDDRGGRGGGYDDRGLDDRRRRDDDRFADGGPRRRHEDDLRRPSYDTTQPRDDRRRRDDIEPVSRNEDGYGKRGDDRVGRVRDSPPRDFDDRRRLNRGGEFDGRGGDRRDRERVPVEEMGRRDAPARYREERGSSPNNRGGRSNRGDDRDDYRRGRGGDEVDRRRDDRLRGGVDDRYGDPYGRRVAADVDVDRYGRRSSPRGDGRDSFEQRKRGRSPDRNVGNLSKGEPRRFFIFKAHKEELDDSIESGYWCLPERLARSLEGTLNDARVASDVLVVVSLQRSNAFQAYGRMEGKVGPVPENVGRSASSVGFAITWKAVAELPFQDGNFGLVRNPFYEDKPLWQSPYGTEIPVDTAETICARLDELDMGMKGRKIPARDDRRGGGDRYQRNGDGRR